MVSKRQETGHRAAFVSASREQHAAANTRDDPGTRLGRDLGDAHDVQMQEAARPIPPHMRLPARLAHFGRDAVADVDAHIRVPAAADGLAPVAGGGSPGRPPRIARGSTVGQSTGNDAPACAARHARTTVTGLGAHRTTPADRASGSLPNRIEATA